MVDTSLGTISKLFFNQIKNLSRRSYLEWHKHKYGINILDLDGFHLHSTFLKLETYK